MNLTQMNHKLSKGFEGAVSASLQAEARCIVVSGSLKSWDDVVAACSFCSANMGSDKKKAGWHVVNHIEFTGAEVPEMRMPNRQDNTLDGEVPDVLVIGGGVIGAAILRELSRYKLSTLLVEKEADLAMQASSRNDGEVHPGVDLSHKNLKQHYVLLGNAAYPRVCEELGVPFTQNGQYVAFAGKWLRPIVGAVALQRRSIGVKDTRIVGKRALYAAQPKLKKGYDFALYNPSAGCVCPYGLTIAYGENAIENGARIALETAVVGMDVSEGRITAVQTNRGTIRPRVVIIAAGIFSDTIAKMAGDEFFSLHPRRGTEAILDNKAGALTDGIVSFKTLINKEKHTKGGGILHTVHGNILVGPTAQETYLREDYSTDRASIDALFAKQQKAVPELSPRDVITYFTGVRAANFEEDFIVEKGRMTKNLVHAAAIQSPGLTAAPAIATDVCEMALSLLLAEGVRAEEKPDFNPIRKPIPSLRNMSEEERAALIAENPDYGVIVCRCEEISKGEILDALKRPLVVPTLDGIKKRVRPGMGRCQGGFCSPIVTELLAEHLGVEPSEVTKSGGASHIGFGEVKPEGGRA